jgi:hypothetical protein
MTCHGFLGGFADGQFCLFKSGNNSLEIWTRSKIEPIGSRKVVLEDQSYDSDFWIPSAAMISFEEMVAVGNAFLVSSNDYVRTRVYEYYDNWDGDVYRDSPEQPAD